MFVAVASLLFRCNETFSRHGERSLLWHIEMCDINVEILCWYDNVCLVRIDNYDNLTNNVYIGTPGEAYTWDIASEILKCIDWRQRQDIGLLNIMSTYWVIFWVAWHTSLVRFGRQTIQGHENGLLGLMWWVICVYMHHIIDRDWVAWQTRSTRLGRQMTQGHENGLLGPTCWVGCIYMHHYGNMNCW